MTQAISEFYVFGEKYIRKRRKYLSNLTPWSIWSCLGWPNAFTQTVVGVSAASGEQSLLASLIRYKCNPAGFLNLYCGWKPTFRSVVCFNIHLYGDFHQQTHTLVLSNSDEGFSFWSFSCLQNDDFLYSLLTHSLINLAKQIAFIVVHRSILQSSLADVEKLQNISIFFCLWASFSLIGIPWSLTLQKQFFLLEEYKFPLKWL